MAGVSCRSVILRIKFLLITLKLFFLSARSCSFALVRAHRSRSWCRRPWTGWGSRSLVSHGHHGRDGHQGSHGQFGHDGHSDGGHGSHVGHDQKDAKIKS